MNSNIRHGVWLTWTLVKREFKQGFQGSLLGMFWPLLYNLMMLALYGFVFSVILKVKWENLGITSSQTEIPFWLVLFAGQAIFFCFAENLSIAPDLVVAVPNYVKKVIFPLHILPFLKLGVSLFTLSINIALLFAATIYLVGFSATFLYVPLVLVQLCFWCLGVGWLLGALGVYFRDLTQVARVVSQLLFFATPIVYPFSAIPDRFRFVSYVNPLTNMVETMRGALFWGQHPDWLLFGVSGIISVLFALASFWVFQKLRPSFADVM